MKSIITAGIIAVTAAFNTGCSSIDIDKTWQGAGVGALGGALVGGIIGHQTGNKGMGAAIGAGLGGVGGGLVGNQMEKTDKAEAKEAKAKEHDVKEL